VHDILRFGHLSIQFNIVSDRHTSRFRALRANIVFVEANLQYETPRVCRRLFGLNYAHGDGFLHSIVYSLDLRGGDISDGVQEPAVVEPIKVAGFV